MSEHEITLTIRRVKDEHVAWTVRAVNVLPDLLSLDGSDVACDISVERDRDGVERVHEYLSAPEGYEP